MDKEKIDLVVKNEPKEDPSKQINNSDGLLGKKKLRIFSLIDKTDEKKSNNLLRGGLDKKINEKNNNESGLKSDLDNFDDEEESDEEIEKYKNLISGRINLKNVLSNFNNTKDIDDSNENKLSTDNFKSNLRNNLTSSSLEDDKNSKQASSQSQKLLSLLPAPKKNLSDNIQFLQFCTKKKSKSFFQIGEKFRDLANPDSDIIHQEKKTHENSVINSYNYTNNNINTFSINIDDQIDKNWELKYLRNLEQKDDRAEFEEPSRQQINKNHIKALISDHKKTKSSTFQSEAAYSKYNKISTRNKYGW